MQSVQRILSLLLVMSPLALMAAGTEDLPIHGAISATASYSNEYNYYGDTANTLNLNSVDMILNSTHRFSNGLRVGVQAYAYRLADFNELTLDFASLDYSFNDMVGVRLGRVKLPFGLYNDSQDLDSIRTFASLPSTFYSRSRRAVQASVDGGLVYGSLRAGSAGSFDYQVFVGTKQSLNGDSPTVSSSNNIVHYDGLDFGGATYGGTLTYNTPVEGLKFVYSYLFVEEVNLSGSLYLESQLRGDNVALANTVDAAMGAGAWNARFAGTPASIKNLAVRQRAMSAEYTVGNWVLAGEYKLYENSNGYSLIPALALLGSPALRPIDDLGMGYYGMVSYQVTPKLGVGVYYCYDTGYRKDKATEKTAPGHSKDYAAAVSYAINKWWLVKAEIHQFNGTQDVNAGGTLQHVNTSTAPNWNYLVLKSTISF